MLSAAVYSRITKNPSTLLVGVFAIACLWIFTNHSLYKKKALLVNDMAEYYLYLPAFFLHHDLSLGYIYSPEGEGGFYWYKGGPNGSRVIKMTCGVACMQAPFFGLGHFTAKLTGSKADGWSAPYQFWVGMGSIFYAALGLWLLSVFLGNWHEKGAVFLTLAALGFGTNLLYYSSYENCMSHAYTFCVLSGLMCSLSAVFQQHRSLWRFVLAGMLSGLLVLIRPVNVLLLPLAWAVTGLMHRKNLWKHIADNAVRYMLLALPALLVMFPQFLYWKTVTGQWYFYSYVDEHFFFGHSHMFKVLFGYRKGLFVYCPVFFLLFPGMWFFYRQHGFALAVWFAGLMLYVYVISCWWCWWYGGSFGMRALIDVYPLLALPGGGVCAAARRAAAYTRLLASLLTTGSCLLLWIQYFQYKNCIIHFDGMNKRAYWKVFLSRRIAPPGYVVEPDYEKAVKGIEIE